MKAATRAATTAATTSSVGTTKVAVTEITDPETPVIYGRLFMVPKSSGVFRPVIDFTVLHSFLGRQWFRMETLDSVGALV